MLDYFVRVPSYSEAFAAGKPAGVAPGGPLLARSGPEVVRPDRLTVR